VALVAREGWEGWEKERRVFKAEDCDSESRRGADIEDGSGRVSGMGARSGAAGGERRDSHCSRSALILCAR
jgi:hypothetical protein